MVMLVEGVPEMPISENELMWARTMPEEVEASGPEVLAESVGEGTVDEQEPTPKEADEADEAEPVVRVEETSRLEATLARLEMNSIEIKMHLDSLEQRISRMEPYLEERSRGGAERAPEAEPVKAREVEAPPALAATPSTPVVTQQTPAQEKSPNAEAEVSREAKEDRWSHLMGPDFDGSGAATPVPFGGLGAMPENAARLPENATRLPENGAGTPGNGSRQPVQAAMAEMPAAVVEVPELPLASEPETRFAMRSSARPTFQRDATEAWQSDGAGELAFSTRSDTQPQPAMQPRPAMQPPAAMQPRPAMLEPSPVQPRPAMQTDAWAKVPVPSDDQGLTGPRFAEREPVESFSGAGVAKPFPVQRDVPTTARVVGGEERREQRLPPRRMFSMEERQGEERQVDARQVEEERLIGEPGMWRGYRVRRLVLAVVLLVLAAIPLAIWWRLSMDARDADAGDAAPASRVEPGAVAAPGEKPSAGEVASTAERRAPERGVGEVAGSTSGHAGVVTGGGVAASVAGAGRAWAVDGGAAPVIRRAPSAAVGAYASGAYASPGASASGRTGGGRTSSGAAVVGGTAIGLAGQPGAADEVHGTTGVRVRVPEGVMAGRLLPVGDVGELPRGSGEVVAAMFISNTGRVEEVQVISGSRGLRDAAARAMRTWRYEPYVQGGVRVPVVTTASIRF